MTLFPWSKIDQDAFASGGGGKRAEAFRLLAAAKSAAAGKAEKAAASSGTPGEPSTTGARAGGAAGGGGGGGDWRLKAPERSTEGPAFKPGAHTWDTDNLMGETGGAKVKLICSSVVFYSLFRLLYTCWHITLTYYPSNLSLNTLFLL